MLWSCPVSRLPQMRKSRVRRALAGVSSRDAGVASGLINTSPQLGGAIGVAVASTVAATRFHSLIAQGHSTSTALTGGFQLALWGCGLTGLVAIPVTFVLILSHCGATFPDAGRVQPAFSVAVQAVRGPRAGECPHGLLQIATMAPWL